MLKASTPAVIRAAIWMSITIVSFLAMAVAVRELGTRLSIYQVLFFRALVALIAILPFVYFIDRRAIYSSRLKLHVARNIIHYGGQFGWTMALGLLTMAEVFALEFTTPLWVAVLAVVFLNEPLARHRIIATIGGFFGVVLIVRPSGGVLDPGAVFILGAAVCYAMSICMVKSLMRTESALTVVFYMGLVQTPLTLLPAVINWQLPLLPTMVGWQTPLAEEWVWLVVMGLGTLLAHYAMARALAIADATLIFPMDFLRMPGVALIAWLLYNESVSYWTGAGAALIFLANYYNVTIESKLQRSALAAST